MRPLAIGGMALLLFFGLSPGPGVAETGGGDKGPTCGDCHDQAKTFSQNPHGRAAVKKGGAAATMCTPCHGDGAEHMEAGGDKLRIQGLEGRCGAEVCMTCHDQTKGCKSRHSSKHSNSEAVNCLTCHSIHSSDMKSNGLLAKKQLDLCSSCHASQASSFRNKPYAHRIGRGGMECSSCHQPHQGTNAGCDVTKKTKSGEQICVSCHAEKKGPFVFPHGAGALGDCMTCHENHGSNNPRRLKRATVYQLCLECHSSMSGGSFGSQPPAFHNLQTARYQNCTTCHTAIHGSNRSPQLLK